MSDTINTQESIDDGIPEVTFTMEVNDVVQAPIDDTLTISGEAADAKATGDAIAALKTELEEEIDTVDDKLPDLKTELEGEIDDAKGDLQDAIDAVAGDVDDLETALAAVAGTLFPVGSVFVSTSSTAPTFGGANWNWQEIMIPVTYGDLMDGSRSYEAVVEGDVPGTLHFWLRIADTEVSA